MPPPTSTAPPTSSSIEEDYYTLLSLPFPLATTTSVEAQIRRAYRKTSLLYHPDKVRPTPENTRKFQLLQIALETLLDPAERAKYDSRLNARSLREVEANRLDARRGQLKRDLEEAERGPKSGVLVMNGGVASTAAGSSGTKRTLSQRDVDLARIREANMQKLREANEKRQKLALAEQREEAENRMMREAEESVEKKSDADGKRTDGYANDGDDAKTANGIKERGTDHNEAEEDVGLSRRSVRVRWVKEGDGIEVDKDWIWRASEMAAEGASVEDVMLRGDKRRKVEGFEKKVVCGNAVIIFKSVTAARSAVSGGIHGAFLSVQWAVNNDEGGGS